MARESIALNKLPDMLSVFSHKRSFSRLFRVATFKVKNSVVSKSHSAIFLFFTPQTSRLHNWTATSKNLKPVSLEWIIGNKVATM